MQTIEVSTTVERPPEVVFPFLKDFTRYADYSKHLRGVGVDGDGGAGTRYRLRFGWWKLTYDAYTRVTEVDAPSVLEWEVTRDLDAAGRWTVEPIDDGDGSAVSLIVTYDPSSVSSGMLDIPALVPLDWVVEKAIGLIESEGRRVVRRVVADLEGEERPVDLTVDYH